MLVPGKRGNLLGKQNARSRHLPANAPANFTDDPHAESRPFLESQREIQVLYGLACRAFLPRLSRQETRMNRFPFRMQGRSRYRKNWF